MFLQTCDLFVWKSLTFLNVFQITTRSTQLRLRELDLTDNHLGPKAVAKATEMGWVWDFHFGFDVKKPGRLTAGSPKNGGFKEVIWNGFPAVRFSGEYNV